MNGNKKQPLVPRLRFPEFRGAVSVLPLDAVADFVSEKFSVDQLTPAQYVSTENLLPDFGGISPATKLPSVSSVTSFRHRDILVSNIRPYLKKVWQSDMCGGVSNDVLVIRPTERVGADYLAAILRSDFFIDYVMRGAKGVKMPRGEISMIREFPVPNPCPEEQQRIADCLSSLDDLIAAETDKLDTLKTHKKGLMQQLFPSEGETVPRLRFPEFREAGEWKPKTIGNSCESFSGGTPSTTNKSFYGGEIPFIRSAEIDKVKTELFLTNEGLENSAAKLVRAGDILVALYGANSGDVALSKINGAINQAILCLRHETSDRFVYQYLSHKKEWIIATFIQGGQGNLSGEIIKAISLFFPNPSEQEHIADCLSSLDDLITAQTQKIDAIKIHKKGLIQQLFPVLDEVPA